MKPRAVFLDYASLRPDDLDPAGLQALPVTLTLHAQTAPGDTIARLQDADIAITNKVVIDERVMAAARWASSAMANWVAKYSDWPKPSACVC